MGTTTVVNHLASPWNTKPWGKCGENILKLILTTSYNVQSRHVVLHMFDTRVKEFVNLNESVVIQEARVSMW